MEPFEGIEKFTNIPTGDRRRKYKRIDVVFVGGFIIQFPYEQTVSHRLGEIMGKDEKVHLFDEDGDSYDIHGMSIMAIIHHSAPDPEPEASSN